MPLLVLYGILVLLTPIAVIFLFLRYSRLGDQLSNLKTDADNQIVGLQRQVAELNRRVQALQSGVATEKSAMSESPAAPPKPEAVAHPVAHPATPHPSEIPPPVTVIPRPTQFIPAPLPTGIPKAAEPPREVAPPTKPEPPAPPAKPPEAPPVHATPPTVVTPPPRPVSPPVAPAEPQKIPVEAKLPPAHGQVPPPSVPAFAGKETVKEPAASRIAAPSTIEPFRHAAPKQTFQQRIKSVSALEETLGTNWLNKLGIIILVVGVALFGIYELSAMGPGGKAFISFLASVLLLGGGIFLEKKETYRVLGRTFIGGGWALLFFSTYGIYHVGAMRILNSLPLDCILMLLVAVAMAVHTLRYRSQFVTGLAFLLGYTTVALSHDTVYSLSAGVILAIGLVIIVLKMDWLELEVFGILSSYLNHLYWLYQILGVNGAQGRMFPEYRASLAMLAFYWLTFRVSYIMRNIHSEFEEHVSITAALLNTLLLLGLLKFQSVQPQYAYLALLIVGALEFTFAQLPVTRRRRQAFVLLTVMGAALMLAAPPFHYSGNNVAILWLLGAEIFLFAGVIAKEVVFRRIGSLTGILTAGHLALVDVREVIRVRESSEVLLLQSGILFSLCAIVLYGNFLAFGTRWKQFFGATLDGFLLDAHSYIAGVSSLVAVWALTARDWTSVALAGVMLTLALLAKRFPSQHLQVQYVGVALIALYRTALVNLHMESATEAHISVRLLTLPLLACAFYVTAKLAPLRDDFEQRTVRGAFAVAGSALIALLIWYEVPVLWQPVAFIAFAVILLEVSRALPYRVLAWHTHVIGACAALSAITTDSANLHRWHTLPVKSFSALTVAAGLYWLAKRFYSTGEQYRAMVRGGYTWTASALMVWVLWELVPAPWIAVSWIVFAIALVLVSRNLKYAQLAWQANVIAILASLRTLDFNYTLNDKIWMAISLRVVTVAIAAAGLYFLSRKAAPDLRVKAAVAFVHSFAATGLLALLAWHEAPNGWLAPLWAGFALVLALADSHFELDELRWQAHILSFLALARSVVFNLRVTATWHDLSVRLLSLALVAVFFYAMSRVVRMPEEWRARDMHHAYSWAASTIVSLLLWYELVPLNVAVGWAVFGLVLFEYGTLRNVAQFRYQSYLALIASFARIFFVNLTAGEPGHFWSPRTYTVLPLVPIYFFVYEQFTEAGAMHSKTEDRGGGSSIATVLATLGTATLVALFYFQFAIEWVVVAWAALVVVLFGMALLLKRQVFLYQGIVLTLLVFVRALAHNLFGSGYFVERDWQGRYFVLGAAIALLLASLFFAFPLRERFRSSTAPEGIFRVLTFFARRPEQLQFFVAIILLTLMLALKMRLGLVTVAWGVEGVLIMLFALAVKERSFRLTGLALLLLCVGKVVVMDVWGLQPRDRYITFIIVGAALLFVSYLYSRYRDAIRQLL
ncbi:MAG TPA: DUF2339 domain-containing protein [Candidatus Acidoferrum sp.]